MRILLLTPPMTQLNTPYPATAYLTGFLRDRGYDAQQADPAIELVLKIFSRQGLKDALQVLESHGSQTKKSAVVPRTVKSFLMHAESYLATVDAVMRFLSGRDPSLAHRIAAGGFLPQGPRFDVLDQMAMGGGDAASDDPLAWAFGAMGTADRARFLASLYVDDLADMIREGIDARFTLSRYGEKLAASAPSFAPLAANLAAEPTLVDRYLDELAAAMIAAHNPDVIGMTVPFPGNVYGAFRIAQVARKLAPAAKILLGGGYVNTELRSLNEPKVFDFFDYITLDDGEGPILAVLKQVAGKTGGDDLLRTFVRRNGQVALVNHPKLHDIPFKDSGTPCYDGLPLDKYLSLCEMLNPMHRIWSDGRWNKLTLAHGCYWKKCNFCDVSLDYIGRYEEQAVDKIVDRIEAIVAATGQSGFHFVDEAAPPKVLFALANRLIARKVTITWWGNIRFEKTFTEDLARKLAQSGCIAVSGGLEVASDRLLKLMNKGVTVDQVARVTNALTSAGILVHAYLMYGFPTQTTQETVDALERVRQLFAAGCIQSAFWHRFSATIHSPIGQHPERFGIKILPRPAATFAVNDLDFEDPTGTDHDALGVGLNKALYNFMHGVGLDQEVRFWFDMPVPRAKVPKNLVRAALSLNSSEKTSCAQNSAPGAPS